MAQSTRKIAIVTGTRAEYGLLFWLMREVDSDPGLELQLIVTGMHLSPEFGLTHQQIEKDGFTIDAKVEMLLSSDTPVGITKSVGLGVIGFADAYEKLNPDIVVLLGDRYEILAAAQAALFMRIPVGHIHGGETTEGAFDESVRHAITKMAQWHFVTADPHAKRVIQMGEDPSRVFNFGAPGLDHIQHMQWMSRAELEESLGIALKDPVFLVTYHPVTLGDQNPVEMLNEFLRALEQFPDATIIITYPNSDTGGRALIERIKQWVEQNPTRARAFTSLGQKRYLSLMKEVDLVVGNSSSGLIETPAFQKATVNIGDRQKGRLRSDSVIDCQENTTAIVNAIQKALSPEFQQQVSQAKSMYGTGNTGLNIKNTLCEVNLAVRKPFFDIEHQYY